MWRTLRDPFGSVPASDDRVLASVFVGTSLDGFLARTHGALDFLPADGGEPHGYDEIMATIGVTVIGRRTFEIVLAFDAWPYGQKPVFALSITRSRPGRRGPM